MVYGRDKVPGTKGVFVVFIMLLDWEFADSPPWLDPTSVVAVSMLLDGTSVIVGPAETVEFLMVYGFFPCPGARGVFVADSVIVGIVVAPIERELKPVVSTKLLTSDSGIVDLTTLIITDSGNADVITPVIVNSDTVDFIRPVETEMMDLDPVELLHV